MFDTYERRVLKRTLWTIICSFECGVLVEKNVLTEDIRSFVVCVLGAMLNTHEVVCDVLLLSGKSYSQRIEGALFYMSWGLL